MFNSGCVQYARLTSITGSIRKSITRPKATSRISPIDLDHPLRLRLTNHATSPSPVASLGEKVDTYGMIVLVMAWAFVPI